MHLSSSRHRTRNMLPGTPLSLDWGSGRCRGKAIVVGSEHALVLSPERLNPGTLLDISNEGTGETARFSVAWCSTPDVDGRCKLGLKIVDDETDPAPGSKPH